LALVAGCEPGMKMKGRGTRREERSVRLGLRALFAEADAIEARGGILRPIRKVCT
jgi:hypothetical protein